MKKQHLSPRRNAFKAIGNSYTQVIFACQPWGGLAICFALLLCSPRYALVGLIATTISYLLALICREESDKVTQGLSGYNPLLTAIAVYSLVGGWMGVLWAAIGAVITYFVTRLMQRWMGAIPVLTAPFVLTSWALVPLMRLWPTSPSIHLFWDATWDLASPTNIWRGDLLSFGEIYLQNNLCFSLVIMLILLMGSWKHQGWVLCTLLLLPAVATLFGWQESLSSGLLGYNPLLVAAALATFPSPLRAMWGRVGEGLLAILFSIVISYYGLQLFGYCHFPLYTAPFVLTTWLLLALRKFYPMA